MILYLVRHGEAVSEQEDPSRPLSVTGRANVGRLAGLLAERVQILPGLIHHSPKARAAQTAAILSRELAGTHSPAQTDGLLPMDDPGIWAERVEGAERDIMLVGHLPHMSRLASLLLFWEPGREFMDFTPGAVACLEKTGTWRLKWMLSPRILKGG